MENTFGPVKCKRAFILFKFIHRWRCWYCVLLYSNSNDPSSYFHLITVFNFKPICSKLFFKLVTIKTVTFQLIYLHVVYIFLTVIWKFTRSGFFLIYVFIVKGKKHQKSGYFSNCHYFISNHLFLNPKHDK